ncbi:MAG: hypothetical protein JST84_05055 [Acidobacteria bacterium]|nr:hypothetical protein [Acidobacteriota bacterium]
MAQAPNSDSVIADRIVTWASQEKLQDFPAWLKRYPNFIPQAGAQEPHVRVAENDTLRAQYEASLRGVCDLFQITPEVVVLDEPGLTLFVVGSKRVAISLGFRKTKPAELRALLLQEFVLASLRQALATAKPRDAYELKLQAYFIAAVASLKMDNNKDALFTALNLRYQIDLQLGIPLAREGVSQASRKYATERAYEYFTGNRPENLTSIKKR